MSKLDSIAQSTALSLTHQSEANVISILGDADKTSSASDHEQDYFGSVVQSMSDSLVVVGSNGRIAAVNPATLQLLGYTEDELIGQFPEILFANGTVRGNGLETLHERGIVQRGEKTLRAKDGRHIPVFYSGSVLRDRHGQVKGVVCVAHDATKQKQLEQGLRDALRQQQELVQLQSQFVATVSHEFRTPLAIILTNSELLRMHQERMGADEKAASFDAVQKQIKHMTRLLEGALTLEKMQAGDMPFQTGSMDLEGLCRSLVEAVHKRVKRDFICTRHGEPHTVVADPHLIKLVVTNLLSNAIKFSTPDSQITLTVSFAADHVTLAIQDQGIGIPETDQARLFEPFFRGNNIGTIGGTGLGLALAKQAIDLHGGTITVNSQIGVGTSVTVTLSDHHRPGPDSLSRGALSV